MKIWTKGLFFAFAFLGALAITVPAYAAQSLSYEGAQLNLSSSEVYTSKSSSYSLNFKESPKTENYYYYELNSKTSGNEVWSNITPDLYESIESNSIPKIGFTSFKTLNLGSGVNKIHIWSNEDLPDNNSKMVYVGAYTVTYYIAELNRLEITPNDPTVNEGDNLELKVTGYYTDGSSEDLTKDSDITWESANTNVAKVSNFTFFSVDKGEVFGTVQGQTTISATFDKGTQSQVQDEITITVTGVSQAEQEEFVDEEDEGHPNRRQVFELEQNAEPVDEEDEPQEQQENATFDSLLIEGQKMFSIGESATLIVKARYSDGSSEDISDEITWSSADENIVTVENSSGSKGEVEAISPGTVEVTATWEEEYQYDQNARTKVTITVVDEETSLEQEEDEDEDEDEELSFENTSAENTNEEGKNDINKKELKEQKEMLEAELAIASSPEQKAAIEEEIKRINKQLEDVIENPNKNKEEMDFPVLPVLIGIVLLLLLVSGMAYRAGKKSA